MNFKVYYIGSLVVNLLDQEGYFGGFIALALINSAVMDWGLKLKERDKT